MRLPAAQEGRSSPHTRSFKRREHRHPPLTLHVKLVKWYESRNDRKHDIGLRAAHVGSAVSIFRERLDKAGVTRHGE